MAWTPRPAAAPQVPQSEGGFVSSNLAPLSSPGGCDERGQDVRGVSEMLRSRHPASWSGDLCQ